jgi:hypothetical protein
MTRPTKGTRIVAHTLVGAAAAFLALKAFGKNTTVVSALLAIVAHEALDAPVARTLAENGIQI